MASNSVAGSSSTSSKSVSVQLKKILPGLLTERRLGEIADLAVLHPRVLSFLTAITYDPDLLISWRAIEAMGVAAAKVAEIESEIVRVHLRRLMWLLSDESGGIGWRAPELMGEVVYHRPIQFAEFIPMIISILDMEIEDVVRFRPGAIWAIGRLAQVCPIEMLRPAIPMIWPCLQNLHAQTVGMAAWCLSQPCFAQDFPTKEIVAPLLADLQHDDRPVQLYLDGEIVQQSLAQLVASLSGS